MCKKQCEYKTLYPFRRGRRKHNWVGHECQVLIARLWHGHSEFASYILQPCHAYGVLILEKLFTFFNILLLILNLPRSCRLDRFRYLNQLGRLQLMVIHIRLYIDK